MKVTLGVILSHGFPVPSAFVVGYSGVLQTVMTGLGNAVLPPERAITEARVIYSFSFPTDVARNEICRMFLDDDTSDALLFLDADMRHPPDIAHRLARHDLPLVTARYSYKRPPFYTVALRKVGAGPRDYKVLEKIGEHPTSGLVPIDAAGAGALLIRREVLEAIRATHGDEWFAYDVDTTTGLRSVSEDMAFFERAKAAGFSLMLDADLECKHVGTFEVDAAWFEPYREFLGPPLPREPAIP